MNPDRRHLAGAAPSPPHPAEVRPRRATRWLHAHADAACRGASALQRHRRNPAQGIRPRCRAIHAARQARNRAPSPARRRTGCRTRRRTSVRAAPQGDRVARTGAPNRAHVRSAADRARAFLTRARDRGHAPGDCNPAHFQSRKVRCLHETRRPLVLRRPCSIAHRQSPPPCCIVWSACTVATPFAGHENLRRPSSGAALLRCDRDAATQTKIAVSERMRKCPRRHVGTSPSSGWE